MVDFRHLPTRCRFIALMPQWDFLNFLAEQAKRYKTFDLRMRAEATDLIEEGGRVVGLRRRTPEAGSRSAPTWWWVAMDAIRPCARKPD